ncbi:hypothetical protein [Shouchella clausii]|uniref:hypothetical protein n=1 Tax=Shouchella clausii TaxID=79880 RepID=UPI0012603AAB|nr:hypothetical protein [Shouchella clausii]
MKPNAIMYLTILLILCMTIFNNTTASAHSPSACKSGGEGSGWKVNCSNGPPGHLGQQSTTYAYASGLAQQYKNITSTGATRWNNSGIVRISYSASSNNYIHQYSNTNTNTVAYATAQTFNNHKSRWNIYYNHSKMNGRSAAANNTTATHELGHSIGLGDLTNSSNRNKLMYGTETRTVTTHQAADRTGAREAVK